MFFVATKETIQVHISTSINRITNTVAYTVMCCLFGNCSVYYDPIFEKYIIFSNPGISLKVKKNHGQMKMKRCVGVYRCICVYVYMCRCVGV